MRKIILLAGLSLGMYYAHAQQKNSLSLKGQVIDTVIAKVYLQSFSNKVFTTIDSAKVVNGTFDFKTPVRLPELYGLSVDTNGTPFYVFLEKGPITVNLNPHKNYRASTVVGSACQDLFDRYRKQRNVAIDAFITENPKSIVSAYALYRNWSYRLTPHEINAKLALFDKSLDSTSYIKDLRELVKVLDGLAIGKKAPDFTAKDPNGKLLKLSDHYTGYTLIDFWAAWCQPCRKENPNIVAAFQQYSDKGFSVFGISLDKDRESWVKGIKDDQLNWPQVSELIYWRSELAKLYGVKAIPANYLVDSKGIIVAKNLRGEALQLKLKELLGK